MQIIRRLFSNSIVSVILPVLGLFIAMLIVSPGFLSAYNITSLLQTMTIFIIIGLAQMSALALGQFNLAIGSMGCITAITMGVCFQDLHLPLWIGIIIGIIVAIACGALQGFLIAQSGINPFIVTLSLLSVYKGISYIISRGDTYDIPQSLIEFNRAKVAEIPAGFLIAIVTIGVMFVIFRYTKISKNILAVGANKRAALFSGINVSRTIISGHTISALLCGIAAVIQVARFGSAQVSVGDDWMLTSFVVSVLGGTLLSGGKVSVIGTFFGSTLMVLINNALVLLGVSTFAFQVILGIVLLGAYEVDKARVSFINRQSDLDVETPKGGK